MERIYKELNSMIYTLTRLNAHSSNNWSFHLLVNTNNCMSHTLNILGNTTKFDHCSFKRNNSTLSNIMLIKTNDDFFFQLETLGNI